jgi:TPR repeat protein
MIAAEGGFIEAHDLVGHFFELGIGVARSRVDALRCYAYGAALGNEDATANLARLQAEDE